MSHLSIRITLLLAVVALLVVACGTAPSAQAPSLVQVAPAAAPIAASAIQAPAQSQAPAVPQPSNAGGAPQSLKDLQSGSLLTYRVDPAQTTVEYAVNEVLFGKQQVTRGQTSAVDGQFQFGTQDGKPFIALSQLQVDLRTLKSDNAIRDQAIRMQWLESNKYPMAVFVAKQVAGLPADAVQGQAYTFQVTGDMTIRDITKPATFDLTVTLNGNTLTGEGTTKINMKDFGFNPPEILGRFTVTDPATITIKGVATLVAN